MASAKASTAVESFAVTEATGVAFFVGSYFAFRVAIVLFSVRILGTEAPTGAAIGIVLGFLLLILVLFQSPGYVTRTVGSMLRLPTLRWVLLFLTFSACSLLWSETVSLSTSIVYWCGLAVDVATMILLLRAGSLAAVTDAILKGFIVTACCLALVAWIMPAQSDLRLGDEEFFNTNQIGNLCAFAIFFAQYLMRCRKGKWGFAVLFLSLTLLRSLSKTTIVAFLISQGYLLLRDHSISRRTKMLITGGVLLAAVAFQGLFVAYYDVYTTAGNQAETLTGRTAIWAYVFTSSLERPWFGHGFDSMWKVVPPFGPDRFEARHAENEMLQQFYAYGAVGLLMLAGIYGSFYRRLRRLPRSPLRVLLLSILLYVLVRGAAEAEPFDLLLPLWSLVLLTLLAEHSDTLESTAGNEWGSGRRSLMLRPSAEGG